MSEKARLRLLCMEDDEGTARLLKKRLERQGYHVDLAPDGESGLKIMRQKHYDVILTDYKMPGLGGLDVIRLLAAEGELPPILLITGTGDERVAVDALKLGADDYVIKDVDGGYLELLPAIIESVLQRHRLLAEKHQALEALTESESRNRALLDAIPDLMFRIDHQGRYLDYRPAQSSGTGQAIHQAQMLGQTIHEVNPELAEQMMFYIAEAIRTGELQVFEYQICDEGECHDYEARIVVSGKQETLAIVRDITLRKRAEQALKASLEEKEVLLKEIHHRVKNNLQIISSLLNLQAKKVQDPQMLAIFRDSQTRIDSMARIHEELYQSKNLASIDFAEYIQNLTTDLFHSYRKPSEKIRLEMHVERASLSVDTAIPCALMLNELISNSLKYAFPAGRNGYIRIDFQQNHDNNQFKLSVHDDGVGLPPGLDPQNTSSLGLRLVRTLTRQLGGSCEIASHPGTGTTFTILFHAL